MDSLGFHNIKAEKANAMFRYRRLQRITAMFRLIELCIFLIIISRFTTQLPLAFKLTGDCFRGLSITAVSPPFVFIVGNAIVIVLFLKSGKLSPKPGENGGSKVDLYDEYVDSCGKTPTIYINEVKKHRKQSTCANRDKIHDPSSPKAEKIHRPQLENVKRPHHRHVQADNGVELRRSVTEKSQKRIDSNEKAAVYACFEDEMSSEEFRRTVEAFIARQQRFLREEELSATVSFESY